MTQRSVTENQSFFPKEKEKHRQNENTRKTDTIKKKKKEKETKEKEKSDWKAFFPKQKIESRRRSMKEVRSWESEENAFPKRRARRRGGGGFSETEKECLLLQEQRCGERHG